jgi:hypothetical protein
MMRNLLLTLFLIFFGVITLTAQTVDVTFKVDMRLPALSGKFNPATDGVELRGSFDGWGAGADMSDNNDSIYVVTITGQPQSTNIFYKFYHTGSGGTWESDPNREVNTGTGSTLELNPTFFNERPGSYTGIPSTVTFKVDMRLPLRGGMELTDTVYIAGNFTDWQNGAIKMTGPDTDSVYTAADVSFTSGDFIAYKFIWSTGAAGSGNWESIDNEDFDVIHWPNAGDNNRGWGIEDGDNEVSRLWENTDPNAAELADGNVLFEVDMSVMDEVGIFDNTIDTIRVHGSFNGWGGELERAVMNQGLDPNEWSLNVPFVQWPVNGLNYYKYWVDVDPTGGNPDWEDPYERPLSRGGGNRVFTYLGQNNQEVPVFYYDDVTPDLTIPAGTNLEIIFSVDMTYAMDPDSQGVGTYLFNPATDTVFWISEQPAFQVTQGWNTNERIRAVPMSLQSGNIYTGALTVQEPSFNAFEYRYAYSDTSGGFVYEADTGPGGAWGYRVRYVPMDAPHSFTQNPYTAPTDGWTNSPKSHEGHPLSVVEDLNLFPDGYSLQQNYPNPFNPSTKIRFSVPKPGLVTLKVFNVLGEEVESLINYEMISGTYDVIFDASTLSSGIYFYKLEAGNFVETKKMILLK